MSGRKKVWHIIYLWLVIGGGLGLLYCLFDGLNLNRDTELLVLIVLMILAEWLAVLTPQGKLWGGFAVQMTAFMLLGPASAVWITALAIAFGQGIVNRGQPLRVTLFNAAQAVIAMVAANQVYVLAGGQMPVVLPGHGVPLLLFVLTYALVNRLLTCIYLLPQRKAYPAGHWLGVIRLDIIIFLLAAPMGLLMTFAYPYMGIYGAALVFMPVLAAQLAMGYYLRQVSTRMMLHLCYTTCRQLNHHGDARGMLETVLKEIHRLWPYHSGAIYLCSSGFSQCPAGAIYGPMSGLMEEAVTQSDGSFVGQALLDGVPQVIYDTHMDNRTDQEPELRQWHRSLLLVPLVAPQQQVLGMLLLGDKRIGFFKENHLQLATILANQLALALALTDTYIEE